MTDHAGIIVAGIIAVGGLYLIWQYKRETEDAIAEHIENSIPKQIIELKEGDDVLEKLEEVKECTK